MLPFCERVVCVPRKDCQPVWRCSFPHSKEPLTIGEHLRKRRYTLRLHQAQAAQKLGVSSRALGDWEYDKPYPLWRIIPQGSGFITPLDKRGFLGIGCERETRWTRGV